MSITTLLLLPLRYYNGFVAALPYVLCPARQATGLAALLYTIQHRTFTIVVTACTMIAFSQQRHERKGSKAQFSVPRVHLQQCSPRPRQQG
jgi:hypothetical protein